MRIAFTSCSFTRVFADQPVWDQVRASAPDHLVLLGDSTYFDLLGEAHPSTMTDVEFAQHLHALYRETIAQPQFKALVQALPAGAVHAIWDDHDFLWNDALGAEAHPVHTEKVRISTAFLEAFRAALAQQLAPGSFPAKWDDPPFWNLNQPPLTTPTVACASDVLLHLTDGRTNRTRTWAKAESKRTIFGAAQLAAFEQRIAAAPGAIHLWASGSTVAGYQRYTRDLEWLRRVSAGTRVLVLSGDIHRNELDAFFGAPFPLHEATSSGAAVRDAVIVGAARQNFGLLDIDVQTATIRLFAKGREEKTRTIVRHTWLPA